MNARTLFFFTALLVAFALMFGCNGSTGDSSGSGGTTPPPASTPPATPTEKAQFVIKLSSYAETSAPQNGGQSITPLALNLLEGGLLAIEQSTGKEEVFSFALIEVDQQTLEIRTTIEVDLPTGTYDFYFLLTKDGVQYGGAALNWFILGGSKNAVVMTINPLVGLGSLIDVTQFRTLAALAVVYDPNEVSQYGDPRVGISLDNGTEQVFGFNVDFNSPRLLIFLTPGEHNLALRFFDGSIVQDVLPEPLPVVIDPTDPAPTEVVLVPLTAEVTYTFIPNSGGGTDDTATFNFTIPKDVVAELTPADPPDTPLSQRLKTVASVVGPENTLVEQELTLQAVTDSDGNILHYSADLAIGLFTPGKITWQLNFIDLQSDDQFAYCAETVDTANTTLPDAGTFKCDLNLLERELESSAPVGSLALQVKDTSTGQYVEGVVVLLNGESIGLTGGGTPGEALGTFLGFLQPGDYTVQVLQELLDPFGSGQIFTRSSVEQLVTITDNPTPAPVLFELPPFPFGAPKVLSTSPDAGDVGIPVDQSIVITFSHPMDPATTGATLSQAPAGVWSLSADGRVLTFQPTPYLAYQTSYTVQVWGSSEDIFGIPMGEDYIFGFSTGVQPDYIKPTVDSVSPVDQTSSVAIGTTVIVTFSEAMDWDSTNLAFKLAPVGAPEAVVPGTLELLVSNTQLVFQPAADLDYETQYLVTVFNTATDTAGNPLVATFESVFTTGSEPDITRPTVVQTDPLPEAVGVEITNPIEVVFSEAMQESTVQDAFSVKVETLDVPGSLKMVEPGVALFTPKDPLAYDTEYRVTIGTAAQDTSNNALAEPYPFRFRTKIAPPAPQVLELEAARTRRPTRHDDGYHDIDAPLTVRIPYQEAVEIALDADGNPLGDPNRYLFFLYLGKVKCMYVGGKWDRHIGGLVEHFFERTFKSPVCNKGYRAGDELVLQPNDDNDDGNDGDHHSGGHDNHDHVKNRAEIKARVITGHPFFPETRVKVTIELP